MLLLVYIPTSPRLDLFTIVKEHIRTQNTLYGIWQSAIAPISITLTCII